MSPSYERRRTHQARQKASVFQSMKKVVKEIIKRRAVNAAVRVPLGILLSHSQNKSVRHFLLRIPVVSKFRVELPDGNSIIMHASGSDVDHIARKLFWWGFRSHEAATATLFYELAKNCSTIFDVGANIGYFTLLAATANRKSHIVAFEPVPEIFEHLNSNIQLNQAHNVTSVYAAVTNHDGSVPLYLHGAQSSVRRDFRSPTARIEVPSVTLDSYVKQNEIGPVGLMKIDVETGEPQVFERMQHILQRDKPHIICEVLSYSEEFLNSFLSDYGYRFYWITNGGLLRRDTIVHDNKYQFLNYLFTKEDINGLGLKSLSRS